MNIEKRTNKGNVSSEGNRIKGTASPVYDGTPGTEYDLFGDGSTYERFAPGAFDSHLATNPDVVCLFNHNADHVLGRTPDTLRLTADQSGLHYSVDLPDTTTAKDLKTSIARGDIRGSSFAFRPTEVEWTRDGAKDIRLIRAATVHDVSPVTTPAYGGSSCGLRSAEERQAIEKERDEYRAKIDTDKRLARWESLNKKPRG